MMELVHRRTIPEHRVEGLPLGRHVHHDPRSRAFIAAASRDLRTQIHATHGLPLLQARGSCTAEALCGCLDTDPDLAARGGGPLLAQRDADDLYDEEIVLEGGDPATDDPGGSGLTVCRAAKHAGLVRSYRHAFGLDHALRALVLRPVMVGSNWYDSMDRPSRTTGIVSITAGAQVRGGHEFMLFGVDAGAETVLAMQSWGPGWGLRGVFRLSFATLERLLAEEGDCTVPYP